MERANWPRIWMIVAAAFGLFAALLTLSSAGASPRIILLALAVWQAMAASLAATGLLLGTWVERLRARPRARPLAISRDRAIQLVPIVAGAGLVVASVLVLTIAVDPETLGLGIAGMAVALGGLWASRTPSTRLAIGMLVATILVVEVPRELGWINITFEKSSFGSSISSQREGGCSKHALIELQSQLTGNVGGLISSDAPEGAVTSAEVTGKADAGWFACMLPLAKPVSYSAHIHWQVSGACSASGDLDIKESAMVWGIKSCRATRIELAVRLRRAIADAIHGR